MIWLIAATYWLFLFALAALNGALRQFVLAPLLGASTALPLSGITLVAVLVAASWFFVHWKHPSVMQAAGIGLLWMALTLVGEAALALEAGHAWASVANAFTISAVSSGELFAFAVLAVGATPLLWTIVLQRGADA